MEGGGVRLQGSQNNRVTRTALYDIRFLLRQMSRLWTPTTGTAEGSSNILVPNHLLKHMTSHPEKQNLEGE